MGHDAQGLRDTHESPVTSDRQVRHREDEGGLGGPYVVKAKAMKALFGSVS